MIMIKKILIIIFFLTLNSCGYTPIYSDSNNNKFTIESINIEGDREINNFLKSKFQRYSAPNQEKKFSFNINTNYIKNPISKDTTGKIIVYQLEISVIINVKSKHLNKNYNYRESFLLKNDNDKFEEKSYENSIKQNLTNTIFEKFILNFMNK